MFLRFDLSPPTCRSDVTLLCSRVSADVLCVSFCLFVVLLCMTRWLGVGIRAAAAVLLLNGMYSSVSSIVLVQYSVRTASSVLGV